MLDAGVVLARLDSSRRSFRKVRELFEGSRAGRVSLLISVVNLAEVLEHASAYAGATGLDPVALLAGFKVRIHAPDVSIARKAAEFASLDDASLADRFASATAHVLRVRLYTTDTVLARALQRRRFPCTLF